MKRAPRECPACNATFPDWKTVDTRRGGFAGGKAAAGLLLAGPVGLAAGLIGKRKSTYYCKECGYTNEYKAAD